MKRLAAALGVLAALAVAGFVLWTGEAPLGVRRVQVALGDVAETLTTNGRIEPVERLTIHAETTGHVTRIAVRIGDAVSAGQTLVLLDRAPFDAEVGRAQARLDAARADLAALERGLGPAERAEIEREIASLVERENELAEDLAAARRLTERGAAPREQTVRLERELAEARRARAAEQARLERGPPAEERAAAEARVREAEAGLAAARAAAALAEIRAPAAGRVYSLAVRRGDFVSPGTPVARLAGGRSVRASIFIDEPELGKLAAGRAARLTADAFPGRAWTCRIERLPSEIVELGNRRVGETPCAIEGEAPELLPGLTVGVAIQTASRSGVPVLPREAVERVAGADFVWVADEAGRARRRPVALGVRGDSTVEVVAGAAPGEAVLLSAGVELTEGRSVAPRE